MSTKLSDDEIVRLLNATHTTLREWTERLHLEATDGSTDKVTALRDGMAVHGGFGQPWPLCQSPLQRIVYARNETNCGALSDWQKNSH
ncbi:MAG: hypothetical protein JSW48_12625 [Betaproteobacteria bacterium]|jgi:formamidopyrimidine-DNA glycosylase|nr:MAG: hypothetical protein JSW48_12625 [Betaproteobacteria bacterium]